MKYLSKKLMIFLSFFIVVSCVQVNEMKTEKAIESSDITYLETRLSEIKSSEDPDDAIDREKIEKYLSDYYLRLGNNKLSGGLLDPAIKLYRKSISYNSNVSNNLLLRKTIRRKKEIDDLVEFFCSSTTSIDKSKINELQDANYERNEIPEYVYLRRFISNDVIRKYLQLEDILFYSNTDPLGLYLHLREESPTFQYAGDNTCRKNLAIRYEQALENARNEIFRPELTEDYSTRITLFNMLEDWNNNNSTVNEDRDKIKGNLQSYFIAQDDKKQKGLHEIYELFLYNRIIEKSYDIKKIAAEYVSNNSYSLSIEANTGGVASHILAIINSEETGSWGINPNSSNKITVTLDVEKLKTSINPTASVREVPSRYLIGTHSELNPEYNIAKNTVNYFSREYENESRKPAPENFLLLALHEASLSTVQSSLHRARVHLEETPMMLEIEDYQEYKFREVKHSIIGYLDLTLNVKQDGKPALNIPIYAKINVSETSHIGVADNDFNGYKEKTALVPTEIILENMLIRNAAEKVIEKVSYEQLSDRLGFETLIPYKMESKLPSLWADEFIRIFTRQLEQRPDVDKSVSVLSLNKNMREFKKLKDVVKFAANASCQIVGYNEDYSSGSGTAYFISDEGYLITNQHVVEGKSTLILLREIKNEVKIKNAKLLYEDKTKDLALLKTDSPFLNSTSIIINDQVMVEMGEEIIYVGYPGSPITSGSEPFTSRGIVSQIVKNDNRKPALVLFDITANPGSSGSSVIKESTGELVGTLTWGFGRSISMEDMVDVIGGQSIRIKESQNVGTSVNVLLDFLVESGYYQK